MQGLLGTVPGFMSEQLLDEPNSCICSNISDRAEILVWESTLWEHCLRIICSLNTSLITLLLDLERGAILGTSDYTRIPWRKTMAKIQLEIELAQCLSSCDTTTLSFDFKWCRGPASTQCHLPPLKSHQFGAQCSCTNFFHCPRACTISFSIFPATPVGCYLGQGQSIWRDHFPMDKLRAELSKKTQSDEFGASFSFTLDKGKGKEPLG